jgi:hypothetical protein
MNVEIERLNSTIRATDSDALLDPQVVEKLVPALVRRVRQELEKERQDRADQQLRPGATARQDTNWL